MRIERLRCRNGGFSLLELALALMICGIVANCCITLAASFASIAVTMREAVTLAKEGAAIQGIVQRLVGASTLYTIHASLEEAQVGTGAVQSGGSFVRLRYADGRDGVVGYSAGTLSYYAKPAGGAWEATANWKIARNLSSVSFDGASEVLTVTLEWPEGQAMTVGGEGT